MRHDEPTIGPCTYYTVTRKKLFEHPLHFVLGNIDKKIRGHIFKEKYFFETFLAITLIVTMAMIPVSGQSPPTPTQVVPSVQDYLQITAATVTNQTGGQLMNAQISTMGAIPAASDDEEGEESETGFGYGILSTGPSNMITVTTDMGLEQEEVTLP